jgi:predicted transposase YbfD/YdcC
MNNIKTNNVPQDKLYHIFSSGAGNLLSLPDYKQILKKLKLYELRDYLAKVPDFRAKRGVRYKQCDILLIFAIATLVGAKTLTDIKDIAIIINDELKLFTKVPAISTLHYHNKNIDSKELEKQVMTFFSKCLPIENMVISLDGKELKGAKNGNGKRTIMLGSIEQECNIAFYQETVYDKTNEIKHIIPLIKKLGYKNAIYTADALHTQTKTAKYIIDSENNYIFCVKNNQKGLLDEIKKHNWTLQASYNEIDCEHGRITDRGIEVLKARNKITFPGSKQVIRITRDTTIKKTKDQSSEVAYYITSLDIDMVTPEQLAKMIRGHWKIENNLHWQRDYTFSEDKSQIRVGNGPKNMTIFRNFAINVLRIFGIKNITRTMKRLSYDPKLMAQLFV